MPATDLLSPAAWERAGAVLRVAEAAGKPVFVHPGPEIGRPLAGPLPEWWAPVVGYATQMQAAWWGWHAVGGRALFPALRVLFAAGAGLAPVHHERHVARGGEPSTIDPDVYVDTSSYGPQALDALVRVLGIDVLALGSDRPYARPIDRILGDAATHAIRVANPRRLLDGPEITPAPGESGGTDMAPSQLSDVGVAAHRAVDYAPEAGRLTLSNLPGRDLDPDELRDLVATIASDPDSWAHHVGFDDRSGSTPRCTATRTSTSGCCAGPRRTTPAGTTTTSPPVRSRSSRASSSRTT